MKLNNKGFTLVELLAVIVILLAISMVAIPNITASLEKNKNKLSDSQKKIIVSSAELFISENKNTLGYYSNFMNGACCLSTDTLKDNNYITDEDLKDSNGNEITRWKSTTNAHVIRNLKNGSYTVEEIEAPTGYKKLKEPFKLSSIIPYIIIIIIALR